MQIALMNAEIFLPAGLKVAVFALVGFLLHVLAHMNDDVLLAKSRIIAQPAFVRLLLVMKS